MDTDGASRVDAVCARDRWIFRFAYKERVKSNSEGLSATHLVDRYLSGHRLKLADWSDRDHHDAG